MAVLILFEGGFLALRRWLLGRLGARLDHALSGLAFERMLALPIDYFETTPVGITVHRMAQATTIASALASRAVATLLDAGVFLLALPLMLYECLPLAFVVAGFAILIVGWAAFRAPRLRERAAAVEAVAVEQGAFVSQGIAGFSTAKSVGLDPRLRQRWDILTARAAKLRLAHSDSVNVLQSVSMPLERLMVFGTFLFGVYLTVANIWVAPLGALFAVLLLTNRIAAPVRHLAGRDRRMGADPPLGRGSQRTGRQTP